MRQDSGRPDQGMVPLPHALAGEPGCSSTGAVDLHAGRLGEGSGQFTKSGWVPFQPLRLRQRSMTKEVSLVSIFASRSIARAPGW